MILSNPKARGCRSFPAIHRRFRHLAVAFHRLFLEWIVRGYPSPVARGLPWKGFNSGAVPACLRRWQCTPANGPDEAAMQAYSTMAGCRHAGWLVHPEQWLVQQT